MNVYRPVDSDSLDIGGLVYRWGGCARPGKWFASLSFNGHSRCHIHLQCVVDDFGNLVPVDMAGMLGTGDCFDYARH